jgi:hypothetical protein
MFVFSNVLHLFTDELSRLCGRRLSFARVAHARVFVVQAQ